MKSILLSLTLAFVLSIVSLPTPIAKANGAIVVLLQINSENYKLSKQLYDLESKNEPLYDLLERAESQVLVLKVSPYNYRSVYYYNSFGYDVRLPLEGYEDIDFHYYPQLDAIIGRDSENNVLVLVPSSTKRPHQ